MVLQDSLPILSCGFKDLPETLWNLLIFKVFKSASILHKHLKHKKGHGFAITRKEYIADRIDFLPAMNKARSEIIMIVVAFLLSPVLGCAVALPLYFMFHDEVWAMIAGTLVGLSLYMGTYFFYAKWHRGNQDDDS